MNISLLFWVSVFILGIQCHPQKKGASWKKVKEKDGIIVYAQTSDSTNLKIVKVTAEVHVPLSALVILVKDIHNQKNWIYLYKYSKILKNYSPKHWIYYGQTDTPWPVVDRDVVSNVVLKQDQNTKIVTITSKSIDNFYPAQKDFVRVPYIYSQWRFVPERDGNVKITFIIEVNAGGNIPLWLMNLTATKGPFHTMKNFLREVRKEKYVHTHSECITGP